MTRPPPDPQDLPSARDATDSALAWAKEDANLGALLAGGVSIDRALLRWGADLLRGGRAADAVLAFRAAIPLAPANALAWTNLGIALARTGADAPSLACLERSVALSRAQPDAWILLGMGRERQGDLARAEADYRVALELEPTSAPGWRCLGALLQREGDVDGAISAFFACLKHGPRDAAVAATLGKMLYEQGRVTEAHAAYAAAADGEPGNAYFRAMVRKTRFMRDLIEGESVDVAVAGLTSDASEARLEREPAALSSEELAELFEAAYGMLAGFGHRDAALRLARRRVELWPESAAARYLLSSLLGDPDLPRSPDEYIVASFDKFAEKFDTQLVDVLRYDVPEQLSALVRELVEPERRYDTLDAGCGTGLCGPLLRPLARRLTGVDLSSKMLACARARDVYDALVCEELTAFLAKAAGSYDLVVAADVLVYFGELRSFFDAAAIALRPGGLFAFSTETSDSGGHRLLPSGRFAHAPAYVEGVAGATRLFETLASRATTLRIEGRERVRGVLFVFQRSPP
jgi:predicted TPR repeat methyltransferase